MELGKIPPHDIEAEQAVIGSMLTDKDAVVDSIEVLKPDDFYRQDNKTIYEAITNLYNRAEPIDIITVKAELISLGKFEAVGGLEYLAVLPDKVPTTANVEKYIRIVEEKSILRKLIRTSNELIDLGYAETEDLDTIMDQAEKKIFEIAQGKNQKGYTPLKEVLVETFAEIEKLYNQKEPITGIPTGFSDLDYKTAGLHNSDLILVAARPSMGKTAFVLNVAENVAIKQGITTAIFSLEMSNVQLVNRMLSLESTVDADKLRKGRLDSSDWGKLVEGADSIAKSHLIIDDTPGISISELRSQCRKYKMENDLGLVIIDYLQLMSGNGSSRSESRQQEISDISRSLKALARELEVPVVTLSQLSRAVEQRPDHRPMLSDLRESGAIEQDADVVMFLYRDDYYNKDTEIKGVAEIIIAKQRNGPIGTVKMAWIPEQTRFANLLDKKKQPGF